MAVIYFANDNLIEVTAVDKSGDADSAVTTGTVEVTLLDAAGAEVAGETWPLALSYNATRAKWRATLLNTISGIELGAGLVALVEVTTSGGRYGSEREPVRVIRRQ